MRSIHSVQLLLSAATISDAKLHLNAQEIPTKTPAI